ncbi:unnamed protein product [Trichobilharzia regenti]|nr:unnamed protein product [Trichobilharzia regenti]
MIRRPVAFTSTICDDRGEELLYAGLPISQVIEEELGIGGVLSLLWFKRRLVIQTFFFSLTPPPPLPLYSPLLLPM